MEHREVNTLLKDILGQHLEKTKLCVVGKWLETQDTETQELFLKVIDSKVPLEPLFYELAKNQLIPFKLTIFKYHLKGSCACQRN